MLPLKFLYFLFSIKVLFCNCHPERKHSNFEGGSSGYTITKVGELPDVIGESSGLAMARPGKTFWTHNDGGSKSELYEIDQSGKLLRTLPLPGAENRDWEDLTEDAEGNVYIGDFGNNSNIRHDLTIYKVNPAHPEKIDSIRFSYSDQKAFPPQEKERNFDCEAFFWHADSLYLFSKNRGKKQVKMYTLPAKPGTYVAQKRGEVFLNSMVTSAAINPSHSLFAVMAYGKVFLFKLTNPNNLLKAPYQCIRVARNQTEAILFVNETDFLATNEQGKIFLVRKK
jgi:hypothetical protein